ncbi:pyruvate dehydrogenase kinase [Ophiocordyceps sinensis CO18]|uniref:Protein-serine/threonine kinase n=1 Tax=Ophiocordyceps sinensis (strain Co18 / CGMCC 3.14243) TaxID=911162 RepID=T5AFR8_OPHSC|nr:pyruvate dehydrogenase kinase [Ophiocordyceps sinensis CO18]
MAQGILEYKRRRQRMQINGTIQSFLDRFYMSRIGIRMLIGQHIALTDQSHHRDPIYVGVICTKTNVKDLAQEAIENARFVCEDHYGLFEAPRIQLVCSPGLDFMYVPGHLSHMLFETLKNSLRAVVEAHGMDKQEFPVTKVIVAEGKEDITIKISDEGGGIPRSAIPLVWTYMYTTVDRTPNLDPDFDKSDFKAPMAGFGYGLPISRLYARYFGGDLKLISMEGTLCWAQIRDRRLSPPQPAVLVVGASSIATTLRRGRLPFPDPAQAPAVAPRGDGAQAGRRCRGGGPRAPHPAVRQRPGPRALIGLAAARRRVDGGEGKWQQKHIKTTRSNSTKPTAARLRSARIDVGLADEQTLCHSDRVEATATGWNDAAPLLIPRSLWKGRTLAEGKPHHLLTPLDSPPPAAERLCRSSTDSVQHLPTVFSIYRQWSASTDSGQHLPLPAEGRVPSTRLPPLNCPLHEDGEAGLWGWGPHKDEQHDACKDETANRIYLAEGLPSFGRLQDRTTKPLHVPKALYEQ